MNKFDRFQLANQASGIVEAVRETFGKWGEFHVDNADALLWMREIESVDPTLAAVTWLNETTFRFISEPNPNTERNPDDLFEMYDVGAFQLNVGLLYRNRDNKFLSLKGLDINKITGTKAPLFNGDFWEHSCAAARMLLRIGQGTITGPSESILYKATPLDQWATMSEVEKNERRVVAYTGPEARPYRLKSWHKFGPMFEKFFEVYSL